MRIAVNTRLLLKDRLEGIGWFAHETLSRITKAHPEHQFIFIFDRPFDASFIYNSNVEGVICSPPARHPLLFYIWFELRLPPLLKKLKADVFLSPDGYLSLRSSIKQVAVIHDINFEHNPKDIPRAPRVHFRYFFPKYARKAARIATVSHYSKRDIAATYGVDASKIDVVYNGVNEQYRPLSEALQQEVRAEFTQGKPYFLFVGAIHPRKNLLNQMRAFAKFKAGSRSEHKFLVVGEATVKDQEMDEFLKANNNASDILFLGRQNLESLTALYAAAEALMYVSKFEGFGVPIIEAFRSGTPVITATNSSMPEIADGAALLADWNDVDAIAKAMLKLVSDADTKKVLIEKGKRRAEDFSWERTAGLLWESLAKGLH